MRKKIRTKKKSETKRKRKRLKKTKGTTKIKTNIRTGIKKRNIKNTRIKRLNLLKKFLISELKMLVLLLPHQQRRRWLIR